MFAFRSPGVFDSFDSATCPGTRARTMQNRSKFAMSLQIKLTGVAIDPRSHA